MNQEDAEFIYSEIAELVNHPLDNVTIITQRP